MLFTATVSVSANTTEKNASDTTLRIAHGIITWVSVAWRPGAEYLGHIAIYHHEHRIFPSTEGMSITGDKDPVEWGEYYESYQPPYELKLKCWNDDDTFDHDVTVRIAILPRKAVLALAIVDAIKSLFTRTITNIFVRSGGGGG